MEDDDKSVARRPHVLMPDEDRTAIRKPHVSSAPGRTMPSLVVLSGCSMGQVYKLNQACITIGRSFDCDIRLDDDGVSRRHAKIREYDHKITMLQDLDSTNGTFVNGEQVKRHVLRDGDRVQIGSTTIFKFSLQDELEGQLQRQLYDAAVRDVLTHTYNRRFFEEELGRAFTHALRHRQALSLLLVDVDHFKRVNDELGHATGDRVLVEVATRCAGTIRNEDVLCRVGGEEFGIIARSTNGDAAIILAERLRARMMKSALHYDGRDLSVTLSIGSVELDPRIHDSTDALYEAADRLLYEAKRTGRNRVCASKP